MTKPQDVTLKARGVHYSEKKEEAYFTVTLTLGAREVSATYTADRYVALTWNGEEKPRDRWTDWRITRRDDIAGVGPKTSVALRAAVEPVIERWLGGNEYVEARQAALANYVIRTLQDGRYGINSGKRAFEEHQRELTYFDKTRIAQAIDHLEAAQALLDGKEADA